MSKKIFLVVSLVACLACPGTAWSQTQLDTVTESPAYTMERTGQQRFAGSVNLTAEQAARPLTLTFYNGGKEARAFSWVRVSVNGDELITERNFDKEGVATVDASGLLATGANQILIDAGGYQGSTLRWVLSTPKVGRISVKPLAVYPGESITISGTGFSPNLKDNAVKVAGAAAEVDRVYSYSVRAAVPASAKPGTAQVELTSGAVAYEAVPITVKPLPELTRLSLVAGSPGTELTIQGKNFAKNLAENQVLIGGVPANVIGGGTNSLTVVIPPALDRVNPSFGQPVVVKVAAGKVASKNSLPLNIQMRVIPMPAGESEPPAWQSTQGEFTGFGAEGETAPVWER